MLADGLSLARSYGCRPRGRRTAFFHRSFAGVVGVLVCVCQCEYCVVCRTLSSSSSSRARTAVAAHNGRREHMGALAPGAQFNLPVCVVCERANMSLDLLQAVSLPSIHLSLFLASILVADVRFLRGACARRLLASVPRQKKKQNALATCTRLHVARCRGVVASRRVRAKTRIFNTSSHRFTHFSLGRG